MAGPVAFGGESPPSRVPHGQVLAAFAATLQHEFRFDLRTCARLGGRRHGHRGLGVAMGFGAPVQEGHEKLDLRAVEIHEALVDSDWRNYTFVFQADEAYIHVWPLGKDATDSRRRCRGRTLAYYFLDDFFIEPTECKFLQPQAHSGGLDAGA